MVEAHKRICIENVSPQVDCGTCSVKKIVGEPIEVSADVFTDGHDHVQAMLLFREQKKRRGRDKKWQERLMKFEGNDHWTASFSLEKAGMYEFTIEGRIDHFSTWQAGLKKKYESGQPIKTELLIGAEMMEEASERASASDKKKLDYAVEEIKKRKDTENIVDLVLRDKISHAMFAARDRNRVSQYDRIFPVKIERERALFSSWYEFFPRSTHNEPNTHGTFKTSEKILPEIAKMGFDVIYLPPIHPIGQSFRKGVNNAPEALPGDPGSPWAIGSEEGGHKTIHPELGTMKDFNQFVKSANKLGMEIALDFAIQCSQDHPYVKEHPEWFTWRPDGTVQYAENPPKKYQDVLPVNFETEDWENLWNELKSIIGFWIDKGVKIFRVDNPHTKSFVFWEWLIKEINKDHDNIIFLAEAFTRPRVMEKLAKVGFTQSYTYFTWRNTKDEFEEYLTELTKTNLRNYFRPNFWPNTPDILPKSLEDKETPSFLIRLLLAGTLSSNYGIYGPLFEFGLNEAYPGKEEYTRSEKYEIKQWDWEKKTKIKDAIILLNKIRKENKALQTTWNLDFCKTDNDQLLCFHKISSDKNNKLIIVISLDPENIQSGWVKVPLSKLGLKENKSFKVRDLLTDAVYIWENERNYVALHPQAIPAHILRIENTDKE